MDKFEILKETKNLSLINGESLIKDVCTKLNLSNVTAPTSYEEVYKRNGIYHALLMRPELREQIKNFNPQPTIPHNEKEFLKFYFNPEPDNGFQYFKGLEALAQVFSICNESAWLQEMGRYILNTLPGLQEKELAAAKIVKTTIEKATNIQGAFTIAYDGEWRRIETTLSNGKKRKVRKRIWKSEKNLIDAEAFGYQKHFYGLYRQFVMPPRPPLPKWVDKWFWKFIGKSAWYKKQQEDEYNQIVVESKKRFKENFYKDKLLNEVPHSIRLDVEEVLKNNILSKSAFEKAFPHETIKIRVLFSYDGEALLISILDIAAEEYSDFSVLDMVKEKLSGTTSNIWNPIDYKYCDLVIEDVSQKSRSDLRRLSSEFVQACKKKKDHSRVLKKIHSLPGISKLFEASKVRIPANMTERDYKFVSISHLYGMPDVIGTFKAGDLYRAELFPLIADLKIMVGQIEELMAASARWELPLTSPMVVADRNVVAFDEIYPIHLIGRKVKNGTIMESKDLKVIQNLPALNGQLIGLTGQNSGGKTVCHETIMYNVFLAQAGLPVFGKNFAFNPKEFLGIVLLEEGETGTMELQAESTLRILEEMEKVAPANALLIVDEIGTGTSPEAGLKYGKMLLKYIRDQHMGCIFTTQICAVAIYAEEELGAINYQLTEEHEIKKGIGEPDLSKLLKRVGMDKYLK